MVEYLFNEGVNVFIIDISCECLENVWDKYYVIIYEGDNLYNEEMDIYVFCVLGVMINDEIIN